MPRRKKSKQKLIFLLEEMRPKLFHLRIGHRYTLNMTMWRVSEYAESADWHGQIISLCEFMGQYAKEHSTATYPTEGKVELFTYPVDWSGFNIPSYAFDDLYPIDGNSPIPDWNEHDEFLNFILTEIRKQVKNEKYYLIATSDDPGDAPEVLDHEVAHGLFYLDKEYQKKQLEALKKAPKEFIVKFKKILLTLIYAEHVHEDEMQAYLATGPCDEMVKLSKTKDWKNAAAKAEKIFKARLRVNE